MPRKREVPVHCVLSTARVEGEASSLLRWTEMPGVELLHADYRKHAFLPHWHDAYMLAASAGGAQRLRHGGAEHVIPPGVLVCLNPGELHDGEAVDPGLGWQFRALYLSEDFVREFLPIEKSAVPLSCEQALLYEENRAAAFLTLHRGLRFATSRLERESLFASLLPVLFAQNAAAMKVIKAAAARSSLMRARDYLQAHWRTAISLEDLSGLAGISRYHFLRTFREAFGLPPHAYQMQLRVQHAKELLFAGMPAREVALEVGLYDQAHLTNTLRRYAGATPGRLHLSRQ